MNLPRRPHPLRARSTGFVVLTLGAASVLGVSGAVAAYRSAIDAPPARVSAGPPATAAPAVDDPTPSPRREPRVRWAPCEKPAVLEHGVCVTVVERTVVVPATPPPAPVRQVATVAPGGAPQHQAGGSGHGAEGKGDHNPSQTTDDQHDDDGGESSDEPNDGGAHEDGAHEDGAHADDHGEDQTDDHPDQSGEDDEDDNDASSDDGSYDDD